MVTIEIPYPLRAYVEGKAEVQFAAASVGQLLHELTQQYPRITPHIFNDTGQLRKFILIYLNDEDIRYKGGLEAEVYTDSTVKIIPALAGGKHVASGMP
ncbi:MAG TPA: MoaD/ThiS family protein [Ktedonobacteraceae bacterium]|jgi:molybdopterin synthase sulfur carrier subunit